MTAAEREVSEGEGEGTYTVVYVEDDERLARLTMQYLVSHGLQVFLVTRGDQALGEVLRIKPDVVLLDIMLPGADGFEVCRRIRQHMSVPIVMVTARGEEADRVLGLEGGADDYVAKPFTAGATSRCTSVDRPCSRSSWAVKDGRRPTVCSCRGTDRRRRRA